MQLNLGIKIMGDALNILFIDDEPLIRDLVSSYFHRKKDILIDVASNVAEADKYLPGDYQVILVDLNLQESLDGLGLIEKICQSNDFTPSVIAVTGVPTFATVRKALKVGAYDYIKKPFELDNLFAVVEKGYNDFLLRADNRKLQNELERYRDALEHTLQDQTKEIRRTHTMATRAHINSLHMLAKAAEYHDDGTGNHIARVGKYSEILAKKLGLDEEAQEVLRNAAPMHDVGKVGIPYQIIVKPGKLTDSEYELIKEHCKIGHDILKEESHLFHQAAAEIALSHHERFDGQGYPNGLVGRSIPLYGRIVAVADVFDALVSSRTYKGVWDIAEAVEYLESQKNKHFDAGIVDAFIASLDEIKRARHSIESEKKNDGHAEFLNKFKIRIADKTNY